jgi:hypothetical protein
LLIWALWPSPDGAWTTSTLVIDPSAAKVAWTWTFPYRLLNDAPFTTVGAAGAVTGAVVGAIVGAVVAAVVGAVVGDVAVAPGVGDAAMGDDVTTPAGAAVVADAPLSVAAKA